MWQRSVGQMLDDSELKHEHWYSREAKQGSMRYTHLPTGISVLRTYPDTEPVNTIRREILAELAQKVADFQDESER